jgi:hypothetical protein
MVFPLLEFLISLLILVFRDTDKSKLIVAVPLTMIFLLPNILALLSVFHIIKLRLQIILILITLGFLGSFGLLDPKYGVYYICGAIVLILLELSEDKKLSSKFFSNE